MEAAACARPATGYTYARREPGKFTLYKVPQEHLLTFEQEWSVAHGQRNYLRAIAGAVSGSAIL